VKQLTAAMRSLRSVRLDLPKGDQLFGDGDRVIDCFLVVRVDDLHEFCVAARVPDRLELFGLLGSRSGLLGLLGLGREVSDPALVVRRQREAVGKLAFRRRGGLGVEGLDGLVEPSPMLFEQVFRLVAAGCECLRVRLQFRDFGLC
jgi:hypothetical protein